MRPEREKAKKETSESLEGKKFHIGDVLSVTTGFLVSPRHMEGVYDILNYMTGDNLFTHQLPRAGDECRPYLLSQHPELKDVDASGLNENNFLKWLKEQSRKYGKTLRVKPLPTNAHRFIDPMQEAIHMMGSPEKVIAVTLE